MNSCCKVCISILIFSHLAYNITAILEKIDSDVPEAPVCRNVSCGQGNCVASSSTIFGYECQCFDGWKRIEGGLLPTPCNLPNCSFDLHCGGNTPPQPLTVIPLLNFLSPCNLVWCNFGECVTNGTGHNCQCQPNNENLFDNPAFACFPQCAFGADCKKVGLGPPSSPTSGSPNTVTGSGATCVKILQALAILVISGILHTCL